MMNLNIFKKLASGEQIRICAFGASNSQRRIPGMHWFDYLELGFKKKYGGSSCLFLNAGVGGNTTRHALERFDRDVASFSPDLTLVTLGGNDNKPEYGITDTEFHDNLIRIYERLTAINSQVMFQTYYACDLERAPDFRQQRMPKLMQIVRDTAIETGAFLYDHDQRWCKLRDSDIELYRLLMLDAFHVNEIGNMIIGLDLMRRFEVFPDQFSEAFRPGLFACKVMDMLNPKEK